MSDAPITRDEAEALMAEDYPYCTGCGKSNEIYRYEPDAEYDSRTGERTNHDSYYARCGTMRARLEEQTTSPGNRRHSMMPLGDAAD